MRPRREAARSPSLGPSPASCQKRDQSASGWISTTCVIAANGVQTLGKVNFAVHRGLARL